MAPTPRLDPRTAEHVARQAFAPSARRLVGLEVEWVVHPVDDPGRRPAYAEVAALKELACRFDGRVTLEPGGQVELSTAAVADLDDALDRLAHEADVVHAALAQRGLLAVDTPVDLVRPPGRILDLGRYRAMEAFFDAGGPSGRWMMCNTASVQVNLGHGADPAAGWRLAHLLAPVLLAAFANSPGYDTAGRPWASLRRAAWEGMDPGRTRSPRLDGDPVRAWLDYVLDADVMLVRDGDDVTPAAPGTSFRAWTAGALHRPPHEDDLRYHVTTLFPPVRPRGWLELRVLDALPPGAREVAAVVTAAALHPDAAADVRRALAGAGLEDGADVDALLLSAARHGLADRTLHAQASALFDVAQRHAPRVTRRAARLRALRDYARECVAAARQPHGRTVADALAIAGPRLRPDVGPPPQDVTRTSRAACAADLAAAPAPAP
ncbi:glutamate-cysteine ligase family protein [Kineosporia sp. A_224]|uniref:glutamate-cysteine ligase family protein n=1 Tax=Kineosporia sp. A_224 TaxID=1962180 RepID=UPI0013040783|nr:glutamate-cysteine ligase family protein [Kineosporia sp. A_224]